MLFPVINYHPAHRHWACPNYRRNSSEHILLPSALTSQGCSLQPGHDGQTASSRGTSCPRQSLLPKVWVWWCWDGGICRRRGSPPALPVEPVPGPEGEDTVSCSSYLKTSSVPVECRTLWGKPEQSSGSQTQGISVQCTPRVCLLQPVNSWLRSS